MLTLEGETMNQVSKRLEKAFEAVKTWPADRQEAAAEVLEHMNRLATTPYELSPEELADIERGATAERDHPIMMSAPIGRDALRDIAFDRVRLDLAEHRRAAAV